MIGQTLPTLKYSWHHLVNYTLFELKTTIPSFSFYAVLFIRLHFLSALDWFFLGRIVLLVDDRTVCFCSWAQVFLKAFCCLSPFFCLEYFHPFHFHYLIFTLFPEVNRCYLHWCQYRFHSLWFSKLIYKPVTVLQIFTVNIPHWTASVRVVTKNVTYKPATEVLLTGWEKI